jgi:hypothetical protein
MLFLKITLIRVLFIKRFTGILIILVAVHLPLKRKSILKVCDEEL